tara:strand:+ start:6752 stop:6925 length:174 start_codon:yes stop_codon:yes gene_type:complete
MIEKLGSKCVEFQQSISGGIELYINEKEVIKIYNNKAYNLINISGNKITDIIDILKG